MLDNKNHQWPLIVSAERSRVTSFLSKGPKMKWPCAKTAQADLTRGPGRLTCEKNFMRFGTPVGFTGCMRTKFFVFAKKASRRWKKGFAACCSARLVPRRTFTGREEFFPTRMSREKTDPILFCPLRRPKLYEVFGVPGGHTVFVSMPWGKEKGGQMTAEQI